MRSSVFIRSLYAKCKMHGSGSAQVIITDAELHALISIAISNLGWSHDQLAVRPIVLPESDYYKIPLSWFEALEGTHAQSTDTRPNGVKPADIEPADIERYLQKCFEHNNDFAPFIENLSELHRRRTKYRRILSTQPLPTMDQIGPRALLEFGACNHELQAHWMLWRKWIYDIDNRAAQETGYLFEPLLASCLGGEPVGARNSPVKRLDQQGQPTSKGRQIDCLMPSSRTAYEFKLRVTIAASGQGRFKEELSFPAEAQAAGLKPVLLVLDPTPSARFSELSEKFTECGGLYFQGEDAWQHFEQEAGNIMSVFIARFIKPAICQIEEVDISTLRSISLNWSEESVTISSSSDSYVVPRLLK